MSKSDLEMLSYFWHEKGDPERYIDAERAFAQHPDIADRWQRVRLAQQDFEYALKCRIDELEAAE